MADEGKSIALVILGIVAVIGVVGLVLMFSGATGRAATSSYSGGDLYGGELRQRQGDPLRQPWGEEAWRYVSPVDTNLVDPVYGHRSSWGPGVDPADSNLERDRCRDPAYPAVTQWNVAEMRRDCIPSLRGDYACCALGGQAGQIAQTLYG